MHKLVKVLTELGVDFAAKEHKHYRFKAPAMMDLVVETWVDPEGLMHLSVAHYGKQNGNAMADPEMEFFCLNGDLFPIHFQNDYLGVFHEARFLNEKGNAMVSPGLHRELLSFASQWGKNIGLQGYVAEKRAIKNSEQES